MASRRSSQLLYIALDKIKTHFKGASSKADLLYPPLGQTPEKPLRTAADEMKAMETFYFDEEKYKENIARRDFSYTALVRKMHDKRTKRLATGVHASVGLASAHLTMGLSVVGTVLAGRNMHIESPKLKLLESEWARRGQIPLSEDNWQKKIIHIAIKIGTTVLKICMDVDVGQLVQDAFDQLPPFDQDGYLISDPVSEFLTDAVDEMASKFDEVLCDKIGEGAKSALDAQATTETSKPDHAEVNPSFPRAHQAMVEDGNRLCQAPARPASVECDGHACLCHASAATQTRVPAQEQKKNTSKKACTKAHQSTAEHRHLCSCIHKDDTKLSCAHTYRPTAEHAHSHPGHAFAVHAYSVYNVFVAVPPSQQAHLDEARQSHAHFHAYRPIYIHIQSVMC